MFMKLKLQSWVMVTFLLLKMNENKVVSIDSKEPQ